MKFYQLDEKALEKELETDIQNGLTDEQAFSRLAECGNNIRMTDVCSNILDFNFTKTLIAAFVAALIYIIAAVFAKDYRYVYSAVAVAVTAMTAFFSISAYKGYLNRSVYKSFLNEYASLTCIRNGKTVSLYPNEIMYGDVVILKKGDHIPFDGRVLSASDFYTDETAVTSLPMTGKRACTVDSDNAKASELVNTVFCGSYVVKGTAKVIVTDICKRVYISKTYKNKKDKVRMSAGILDFSKMLTLVLCVLSAVFSVVISLITEDYISLPVTLIIWTAFLLSNFLTRYVRMSFVRTYVDLRNNGIYLKNASAVEMLNNADVLLVGKEQIFDKKTDITGIVTDRGEYFAVSGINKSNFSVILYSSFCDGNSKYEDKALALTKANIRLMRSVGVSYSDIESVCPAISHFVNENNDTEMCGRVYDGNNMLIVRGNYRSVLKMCDSDMCFDHRSLDKLTVSSNDIIAVAIKNVDIIPDDLSEQCSGFKLVGFIGVHNSISAESEKIYSTLEANNIHSILLYSGDETSAKVVYGSKNISCIPLGKLESFTADEIKSCDVICDYDGDMTYVVDVLLKKRLKPAYVGNKKKEDSRSVAFKTSASTVYDNISADAVVNDKSADTVTALSFSDLCFKAYNRAIENFLTLCLSFIVGGVAFAVANRTVLFDPALLSLLILIAFPVTSVACFKLSRGSKHQSVKVSSSEPLNKVNIYNALAVSVVYFLFVVLLFFITEPGCSAGIISLSFFAFLPYGYSACTLKNSCIKQLLTAFAPFIIMSVLFVTPVSVLFGVSGFRLWHIPLCAFIGIAIRKATDFLRVSVKN